MRGRGFAWERNSSRESRPLLKIPTDAITQSLPHEGKVPNASEADEVGRALLLQLNCVGERYLYGISAVIAMGLSQRQNARRVPALPYPYRKEKMPPHPSLSRQLPLKGKPFFRQKAFAAEAKLFSKTQKASAEHCSALAFSHIQTNLWKTHARGPRSWPRKVMASASGPVLADTTQPSWNTFTGGWPNSFLHCFTSSLMRSPSV